MERSWRIYHRSILSKSVSNKFSSKNEKEDLQRLCNQKDQEMLIESMKQAEKEQHYSTLIAEYEKALKDSEEREEELIILKEKNKELEEQFIKEKHKSLQDINKLIKEKEEAITTYKEQRNLSELKDKEIIQLREDNKLLQSKFKESEAQITKLQNTIEKEYNKLQSTDNTNTTLKEHIKELMTNINKSNNKTIELERILKETQEELNIYKTTSEMNMNNAETELKKAHSKILEYKQEINELQNKLMISNDELEKTKRSFNIKLESVIKQSGEETKSRLIEYKENLKRNEEHADKVIKSLESEIAKLKVENKSSEAIANSELERYKELLRVLEDKLKNKELERKNYVNKMNEAEENASSLNSQLDFLDEENTKLRNEVVNLRNDLQTAKQDHAIQLEKVRKQNEENVEVMVINNNRM